MSAESAVELGLLLVAFGDVDSFDTWCAALEATLQRVCACPVQVRTGPCSGSPTRWTGGTLEGDVHVDAPLDRDRQLLVELVARRIGEVAAHTSLGTWHAETAAFQRSLLVRALRANDGNVAATARALGLARSRVYDLLGELRIARGG